MFDHHSETAPYPWPEFFNQYESLPSALLGDDACGPTAVAMAINLLAKNDSHIKKVTPSAILFEAGHLTHLPLNKPHYYLVVNNANADGTPDYLPIGDTLSPELDKQIQQESSLSVTQLYSPDTVELQDYNPVYTINNGLDHRGTPRLLSQHGIKAEKIGDPQEKTDVKTISNLVSSGHLFLASVEHNNVSSHVILIVEHRQQKGEWFLIYDPAAKAPQWINVDEFNKLFRGYGTVIYNDRTGANHDH